MKHFYFLSLLLLSSCTKDANTLFELQSSNTTNINFSNNLTETEKENILSYEYFYNGGGVGAGDFNNDGLIDLFFAGNQVENALYINKGQLKFEDVSKKANINSKKGTWSTGVSVVDINADGLLDMYICNSGLRDEQLRKNQLLINQGITNGIPVFADKAEEYGLADSGYSSQAAFLDYDQDGDLDCFLINHNLAGYERKEAHVMRAAYDYNAGDKLFRNVGINPTTHTCKFTDISTSAGIKSNPLGFGLGVSVSDINQDGLLDIYVANDFVEDDYLYINQGNGTFKDQLRDYIEHTSYSSMGVDIADINNDLLPDILTTDMLPEDNARQKLLVWPDNWNVYQAQLQNGFWHQNMRNMLQLNNGNSSFSEVGQLAGISNTDWSWAVLMSDFDLDRNKDIFISNGIGKDFTNIDFIKYSEDFHRENKSLLEELKTMPNSQTQNYIFKNTGNITFTNQQKQWGFDDFTISNGAITVDLDNDGDLEIVTNNLNEKSRIYKNTSQEKEKKNFIKLKLKGIQANLNGIGAKIILKDGIGQQMIEINSTKGYLSSSLDDVIFATDGKNAEVEVFWANGTYQKLTPKLNQVSVIEQQMATRTLPQKNIQPTFFTKEDGFLNLTVKSPYFNDFEQQGLLPEQYSYFGPKLVKGDLNKDGIEDVIIAGNAENPTSLFLGNEQGNLQKSTSTNFGLRNVQDIVIQDFNGDKMPDLYFVIGDFKNYDPIYQNDELWLNDGKGGFKEKRNMTDGIFNKTAIAKDFNGDGTIDLFLGGFTKPVDFPKVETSMLLLNQSNTSFLKKSIAFNGLITAAESIGNKEILVVGEWMSPTILKWQNGTLKQINDKLPNNLDGWWNCIKKGDIDGDGDDDLVLGNIGKNLQLTANEKEPASLTYSDFDNNGRIDYFMEYFIQGKPYPPYSRDEVTEQIPITKKKFPTYTDFSKASLSDFFEADALAKATRKEIKQTETIILEQKNGKFISHQLPIQAQFSSVFDILIDDFNKDNKADLVLVGNNSNLRLRLGKIDANFGQLFFNKGNFSFEYIPQKQSGLVIKGDAKSIIKLNNRILVGISNAPIAVYKY